MTSKPDTWSSIHKKTNPNELVVIKKLEKFERISLWSEYRSNLQLSEATDFESITILILTYRFNYVNIILQFNKKRC